MKTPSLSGILLEPRSEPTGSWKRPIALVLICVAVLMDALDTSIVNVALPTIQRDLHLVTTDLLWVQGVYILAYGGLQLLGGRAADLLGRRRMFLIGTALFGLASLLCGLANSGWLLILARGMQGIGAALTLPAAVSILTTTFAEGPERNKALGLYLALAGSGFTFGLVLGGVLTTFLNWHWIFFVNIPFVLLILLLAPVVIQEGRSMASSRSYDIAGAITATGGLLLLSYAMTQANQPGATPLKTAGLFAFALALLGVFILIERRSKAPLIPLRIFRSRTTSAANLASLTLLGSFFSFLFIATLSLQNVLHYTPILASLALLPGGIASIPVAAVVTPRLVNRLGVRLSTGLGLLCMASGIALFARIGFNSGYLEVVLPPAILTIALGMGIGFPALSIAAVSGIANTEQGLAAGLQGTALQAGGGLWLAITTAVVAASTASALVSAPSVVAQLSGFHMGLLVAAAGAAAGALIALVGIQKRSVTPLDASEEERREEKPRGTPERSASL